MYIHLAVLDNETALETGSFFAAKKKQQQEKTHNKQNGNILKTVNTHTRTINLYCRNALGANISVQD